MIDLNHTTLHHLRYSKSDYYWRATRPMEYLGAPSTWAKRQLTGLFGVGMLGARDASYQAHDVIASMDFFLDRETDEILVSVEFGSAGQFVHEQIFTIYPSESLEKMEAMELGQEISELLQEDSEFWRLNSERAATGVLNLAKLLNPRFVAPSWSPRLRTWCE